jgi:hypothetical protein
MALLCTGLYADWVAAREVAAESDDQAQAEHCPVTHA